MSLWVAVMAWDADGRTAKHAEFAAQADAESHVARFIDRFPAAFVAESPGGGQPAWRVSGKTLLFDPPLPPAPPSKEEKVDRAIDTDPAVAPLVKYLAEREGISEQEFRDKLYQRSPAEIAAARVP